MRRDPPKRWGWPLGLAGLAVVTAGLAALAGGEPALLIGVPLLVAGLWAVAKLPFRYGLTLALLATLVLENPGERPFENEWQTPWHLLGSLWFDNLGTSVGVPLPVSGLELFLVFLLLVLVHRRMAGTEPSLPPATRPVLVIAGVMLGTAVLMELWGIGRGGDFRQSLWQLRQLFWLPVLAVAATAAYRGAASRRMLVHVLIGAATYRALLALFFYFAIARPRGLDMAYVTTHSDSVVFVMAALLLFHRLVDQPSFGRAAAAVAIEPLLLTAMVLNDRRLAFVALFFGLVTLTALVRAPVRRSVLKVALVASPLLLAYVAAGWTSDAAVFRPVASIRSVSGADEAATRSRDTENFNLIVTAWANPVVGSGYGHEYQEVIVGDDISHLFEQYRYLPHNSVLWLLGAAGMLGFLALWSLPLFAVFIGVRSQRRSGTSTDRVVALGVVSAVVIYVTQAYGDIGLHAWQPAFVLAAFTGAVMQLAAQTGAWRAKAPAGAPTEARLAWAGGGAG